MESIGDYRLIRLLGEGGMGKVYEAEERGTSRRVALKVLRPELAKVPSARRLFGNEMAVLEKLEHPNIVRPLAFRELEGKWVMALELLQGQTLRTFLTERGPAEIAQAIAIVLQIARALAHAHEHDPSIVHRDLKPENVMLLPDGRIKVMDFGIAKVLASAGNTTTHSVGTLSYMSPEQIDAGAIDGRSDLYCLGLVFYELLAGHPPFESQSPRELLNLQCTEDPPPLDDAIRRELPRGVEELLLELLEKTPDDRPDSAESVIERLSSFAPASLEAAASAPGQRSAERRATSGAKRARRERAVPADDTIALLERARGAGEVSARRALAIILSAAIFAAGLTWVVRLGTTPQRPDRDRVEQRR